MFLGTGGHCSSKPSGRKLPIRLWFHQRTVFKWKCFVSAKQMFAFWPVGTNQQMLLLTFPQADWHRTLPSVSFPFSQELSRDSTGGLAEAFCRSNCLVKRVQTLSKLPAWPGCSSGLDVSQVLLKTWASPAGSAASAWSCPWWMRACSN